MCGITGKFYFDRNYHVDFDELKSMTDTKIHRGPDDEGHFVNKKTLGLGLDD